MKKAVARPKNSRAQAAWVRLGALLFVGHSVVALYASPLFSTRQVTVVGVRPQDQARLLEIVEPSRTTPLLQVDRARIVKKLLEDPRINAASAVLRPPATLQVSVAYRQPFALLTDGDQVLVVDRHGVVFLRREVPPRPGRKPVGALPPPGRNWARRLGAPLVVVASPLSAPLGGRVTGRESEAGLETVRLLASKNFGQPYEVTVDSSCNICLNMGSPTRVILGTRDRLSVKIATLHEMLRRSPTLGHNMEYLDLSDPSVPVRKPRATPTSSPTRS